MAKAVEGIDVVYHVAAPHASHPPQVRTLAGQGSLYIRTIRAPIHLSVS